MKILKEESLFEFANITPKRTGIGIQIWSEHSGVKRNVKHNMPRVKLGKDDIEIEISIEESPKILAKPAGLTKQDAERKFRPAIKFIGRNYDVFLKHFNDVTDDFDDADLFAELKIRGEIK